MPSLAVWVFGAGVVAILYVLLGYPVVLRDLSRRRVPNIEKRWIPRSVSIVMPVHNGERWIVPKLESIAQLDYPAELLEVLVVDDGSTDRTLEAIGRVAAGNVTVLSLPRGGKAAALNAGIGRAGGEILMFTDVRQRLDPMSLRRLVECFADPTVGVASGELIILSGETQQEADIGLYWRYEKWIRRGLSRIDSVLGATGCLYAMRRDLASTVPPSTLLDDVYLPLGAFFKGYRVVFEELARAYDFPTVLHSEFHRKVRTQAGLYQIMGAYPRLLLPTTRMWFHFVSHKVGRLLLPWTLGIVAASSLWLPAPWMTVAVAAQAGFYGLAALDTIIPRGPLKRASSLARTFVVLVAAAMWAPIFLVSSRGASGWRVTQVRSVPAAAENRL